MPPTDHDHAPRSGPGSTPDDVAARLAAALAAQVAALPRLRLVGFMTIGASTDDESRVRAGFARLRRIRDEVLASGAPGTGDATELSMGMSGDLEIAVAEGATVVRLGTAVFGARPPQPAQDADDDADADAAKRAP